MKDDIPIDTECYIISSRNCYLSASRLLNCWGGTKPDKYTRWRFIATEEKDVYQIKCYNDRYLTRKKGGIIELHSKERQNETTWKIKKLHKRGVHGPVYSFCVKENYLVCMATGWIHAKTKQCTESEYWMITTKCSSIQLDGPSGRRYACYVAGGGFIAAAGIAAVTVLVLGAGKDGKEIKLPDFLNPGSKPKNQQRAFLPISDNYGSQEVQSDKNSTEESKKNVLETIGKGALTAVAMVNAHGDEVISAVEKIQKGAGIIGIPGFRTETEERDVTSRFITQDDDDDDPEYDSDKETVKDTESVEEGPIKESTDSDESADSKKRSSGSGGRVSLAAAAGVVSHDARAVTSGAKKPEKGVADASEGQTKRPSFSLDDDKNSCPEESPAPTQAKSLTSAKTSPPVKHRIQLDTMASTSSKEDLTEKKEQSMKNILVVGKSGSGKSTLCSMLLQQDLFSKNLRPINNSATSSTECEIVRGSRWTVCDTPGLGDSYDDDDGKTDAALKPIVEALRNDPLKFHYIAYVVKQGRLCPSEHAEPFKLFKSTFADAEANFILIITHCEDSSWIIENKQGIIDIFGNMPITFCDFPFNPKQPEKRQDERLQSFTEFENDLLSFDNTAVLPLTSSGSVPTPVIHGVAGEKSPVGSQAM
ncbi:hypothetical protein BGZ49_008328 [Haplosporangium sp. Z 27]|nr:hypothetical protein BGZ49_008328 [Haplosporangium sp. Z 27]